MGKSRRASYSPVASSNKAARGSKNGPLAVIAGLTVIAAAAGIGYWLTTRPSNPDTAPSEASSEPVSTTLRSTIAHQNFPTSPALKPAWNLINGYLVDANGVTHAIDPAPSDLADAETQVNELLARTPNDPEGLVLRAEIDGYYQSRGIDTSKTRADDEEKAAEVAMQAAGDTPEALFAMAQSITLHSDVTNGAAQLLHQALKLSPEETRYRRLLFHDALKGEDSLDDASEAATKYPDDFGVQVDAADLFRKFGLLDKADKAVSRAVDLSPDRGSALLWKAYDAYLLRGDLAAMKDALDRVNGPTRMTGQFALVSFLYAAAGKDTAMVENTLRGVEKNPVVRDPYPLDADFLLASLGIGTFEEPLKHLQESLAKNPADAGLKTLEIWALHGLGRNAEAKAQFDALVPSLDRPYRTQVWWFDPVALAVILGEKDTADSLLKDAVTAPSPLPAINGAKTDPRLGDWIAEPAVSALLTRTE